MNEKPTCAKCGSDNVSCEAYAEWDTFTHQWVLGNSIDDSQVTCGECGSVTGTVWKDENDIEEDAA